MRYIGGPLHGQEAIVRRGKHSTYRTEAAKHLPTGHGDHKMWRLDQGRYKGKGFYFAFATELGVHYMHSSLNNDGLERLTALAGL